MPNAVPCAMEEAMTKLNTVADSIKCIRDSVAAQIENVLEDMRRSVTASLDKIISDKFNQLNVSAKESNSTTRNKQSFADVVKLDSDKVISTDKNNNSTKHKTENSVGRKRKTRQVIVIKPIKELNQDCDSTRKFLRTNLDPKDHKIRNFKNGKSGSIIVECAPGANVENVKRNIEENLGGGYSAVVPTSVPRLKIVGMSERFSSDILIEFLRSQNENIKIGNIKIVNIYENPRFKYNKYSAVVEVDIETYNCMLAAKKVNVEFDRCIVVPAINVLRCFKCGEFGHKSMECKNNEKCSRCSLDHKTSECTSDVLKCINCVNINKTRKLNLEVNHAAFSSECAVYKKLLNKKKNSLNFTK